MKKFTISGLENLAGFIKNGAKEGERVTILQRAKVDSSELQFYMYINQLENLFLQPAQINGDTITHFFVLFHSDKTADVYTGYSRIRIEMNVTRKVAKGELVYINDISDVKRYEIEDIEATDFRTDDAVVCVMKVGWRYGLFFDFTRTTNAEEVWLQLGELYNSLHINRIIENIQNALREQGKPHFITEGKTDWKHLEAARRMLAPELAFGYPASEDTLGDGDLLKMCGHLSKFGPRHKNKIIAIFDRDNPTVLQTLKKLGDINGYQAWGNNVYSLALPVPRHRAKYEHISIELLYSDKDLARRNKDGKRLFFDNELKTEIVQKRVFRILSTPPQASLEYVKKVFDELADQIEDEHGKKVGLSKAAFAQCIIDRAEGFESVQFDGFIPLIDLIKEILQADPPKSNVKD